MNIRGRRLSGAQELLAARKDKARMENVLGQLLAVNSAAFAVVACWMIGAARRRSSSR
jgi:hypothetical protein